MTRHVVAVLLHGNFGDAGTTCRVNIVSDPTDPAGCEACPGDTLHTVYTTDEDFITMCLPHSFENVTQVEPVELEIAP